MHVGRKVLAYLWPYRLPFLGAIGQVAVINGCELLKPWPIKLVVDELAAGSLTGLGLAAACGGLVLIYLLAGGLTLVQNYTTIRIGQAMVNDLRADLYAHLQRQSLAFHSRRQVGDLLYRLTADTYAVQTLAMNGIFPVIGALVLLVGMFVVMVRIDHLLTLVALSVAPVLFGAIWHLNARITRAASHARERESVVYSVVQRTMPAIRVVQAFTMEEDEHRRFMAASRESLTAGLRLYTLQTLYSWIVSVVVALGTALVVWVGARHVLTGALTIGDLVVFTSYLASLYVPVNTILQTYGLVQGARAGVQRVFEVLNTEPDLRDGRVTFAGSGARGDVRWDNVSFEYLRGQPVLTRVDLAVPAGRHVAIVGPTGAGKSTLLSLVPRFYDPGSGRVMIDGFDVRDFQLASLRRQIAMVLQPPLVFPISVRDNIAYGQPDASLAAVKAAAERAAIRDFIESLPQGYDTVVGEGGVTLSEGEKQRITIARALLRDAPILILDEPTSAVDVETEALIMRVLERLSAGRTTLVIAHRLSTIRRADLIVAVQAGRIVEQGSFDRLIKAGGPFASLYRTHFGLERGQSVVVP